VRESRSLQPMEEVGMPLLGRELLAAKGGSIMFTAYTLMKRRYSHDRIRPHLP
jgi:hypothetical protein